MVSLDRAKATDAESVATDAPPRDDDRMAAIWARQYEELRASVRRLDNCATHGEDEPPDHPYQLPAAMSQTDAQREFLALEPALRQHVVVLPAKDLKRFTAGREPLTKQWRRLALGALGVGGGAGGGAAAAAQLAARAAAGAAGGVAAGPLVIAGGAAGLAVALFLGRDRSFPAGVTLIDEHTAKVVSTPDGELDLKVLYDLHPAREDLYLPDAEYKRFVLVERAREAEAFFLHCGACRIELTVERGEQDHVSGGAGISEPRFGFQGRFNARRTVRSARSTVIEAPGLFKPKRLVKKDWLWANAESDWLDVRRKRVTSNIDRHQLITEIEDQRQLSGDAKVRLAKLASIQVGGSKETFESTKWIWDISFPR